MITSEPMATCCLIIAPMPMYEPWPILQAAPILTSDDTTECSPTFTSGPMIALVLTATFLPTSAEHDTEQYGVTTTPGRSVAVSEMVALGSMTMARLT